MASCKYGCKNGKIFVEATKQFIDCPDCRSIKKVLAIPKEDGVSIYSKLRIPPVYRKVGVSGEELLSCNGIDKFSKTSIQEVGNILETINRDLCNGRVTALSCYIYVSNLVDIRQFVYGAQKVALEKGLQVVPYITGRELYGLKRVGEYPIKSLTDVDLENEDEVRNFNPDCLYAIDGFRLIQATGLTYFDYVHADVCFVELTSNTTDKDVTGVADLIGERSRQGLPTYVIGYWSTKAIAMSRTGISYILSNSSITRLDTLVPYELTTKNRDTGVSRQIETDSVVSSVVAGLQLGDVLQSNSKKKRK